MKKFRRNEKRIKQLYGDLVLDFIKGEKVIHHYSTVPFGDYFLDLAKQTYYIIYRLSAMDGFDQEDKLLKPFITRLDNYGSKLFRHCALYSVDGINAINIKPEKVNSFLENMQNCTQSACTPYGQPLEVTYDQRYCNRGMGYLFNENSTTLAAPDKVVDFYAGADIFLYFILGGIIFYSLFKFLNRNKNN